MEVVENMTAPVTADKLGKFIISCSWMVNIIRKFHDFIVPLGQMLDAAYKRARKCKRAALKTFHCKKYSETQYKTHRYGTYRILPATSIHSAFSKCHHFIFVIIDTNEAIWEGLVTKMHETQFRMPIYEQRREPMEFIGRQFTASN